MNRFILLFLFVISFPAIYTFGQVPDTIRKYTSRELISSYYDEDFNPFHKGAWFTKLSFSLSDKQLDNVSRLFDRVAEGQDFSWNLELSGGYFVGDYFLVGGAIRYDESKFTGFVIDSNSDTINAQSISRNLTVSPNVRLAIPLTQNQRLSFYTDLGLSFGYGRSLSRDIENLDQIQKQFGDQFLFGVGLSPGITFFAVENFAFEVGLNLIGYRLNIENNTLNNEEESRRVEHDVTLRLNLLSLNLGVAYYFGAKK